MSTARSAPSSTTWLHGVLHFEGKIWRTLPLLAWKPGELTRRYIDGERARFVSPIALFLFSVFLMFAVAQPDRRLEAAPAICASRRDARQTAIAEQTRRGSQRARRPSGNDRPRRRQADRAKLDAQDR